MAPSGDTIWPSNRKSNAGAQGDIQKRHSRGSCGAQHSGRSQRIQRISSSSRSLGSIQTALLGIPQQAFRNEPGPEGTGPEAPRSDISAVSNRAYARRTTPQSQQGRNLRHGPLYQRHQIDG